MLIRPLFILKYWLCWIIFFEVGRIGFLLSNYADVRSAGFAACFGSLFYGIRMDMSLATYIALPVVIFVLFSRFIKVFKSSIVYKIYTALVLLFVLLAIFADVGLFKAWGTRLD